MECDLLTNNNSREDLLADPLERKEEVSIRKQTQSSKFQTAKSLGIKSSKTLKHQAAPFGSKALNNLASPP